MSTISSTTLTLEVSSAPLHDEAEAVSAGIAFLRVAAGGGLQEQVFTDGLQAGGVDEVNELEGAGLGGFGFAPQSGR
jgi:hypothetical protein